MEGAEVHVRCSSHTVLRTKPLSKKKVSTDRLNALPSQSKDRIPSLGLNSDFTNFSQPSTVCSRAQAQIPALGKGDYS